MAKMNINIKNGPLFLNWMNETQGVTENVTPNTKKGTVNIPYYENDEFVTFKFYKPISKMFSEE